MKNLLPFVLVTASFLASGTSSLAQTAPAVTWDKTFGGSDDDNLNAIQQTSDGGYIMGGFSTSGISGDKSQASRGNKDFWIVKLNAAGNKVWDKTFGGNNEDHMFALKQTLDGGYILGGKSNSGISGDKTQASKGKEDFWVIKLDASGNKVWDKTFGGSDTDELYALRQTADGGYILGGISLSGIGGDKSQASQGNTDFWVIKLDASGNKTWDRTIGGDNFDGLYALQQTADGGYILGGGSDSGISGNKSQASKGANDYWLVKLNATGTKMWDKTFGGINFEYLTALHQTADGGYIIGGSSSSGMGGDKSQAPKGNNDYWVLKLDVNGNKLWDKTIGGSNDDDLYALQQTSDGGYILGGVSTSGMDGDKTQAPRGFSDYWLVKLDASGNKTWDKALGGSNTDIANSLQQTADGGYIVAGFSSSGISGDKTQASKGKVDFWIVKLGGSLNGLQDINANLSVSIYPNPSQGRFNIKLRGLQTPAVVVTVSDLLGRELLSQEIQATDVQLYQELALPATKGVYLLKLKAGEETLTHKIIIE